MLAAGHVGMKQHRCTQGAIPFLQAPEALAAPWPRRLVPSVFDVSDLLCFLQDGGASAEISERQCRTHTSHPAAACKHDQRRARSCTTSTMPSIAEGQHCSCCSSSCPQPLLHFDAARRVCTWRNRSANPSKHSKANRHSHRGGACSTGFCNYCFGAAAHWDRDVARTSTKASHGSGWTSTHACSGATAHAWW